jgi:hypothetical protein
MPTANPQHNPAPETALPTTPTDDLSAAWRRLALYGYQAIDQALDSAPRERLAILAEAAGELDGAIDELDGLGDGVA